MSVAAPPRLPVRQVAAKLPKSVECVAFECKPGRYRAICLDFSLIAESRVGVVDAIKKLEDQIVDYLNEAIEEGCPDYLLNRGLSRRERFMLKAQLHLRAFWSVVESIFTHEETTDRAVWRHPVACL